jgi:hypothetical protein
MFMESILSLDLAEKPLKAVLSHDLAEANLFKLSHWSILSMSILPITTLQIWKSQ